MYTIVKIELIQKFLDYYNIEYDFLSADTQALICVLANIFVVFVFFVGFYIIYRIITKFFSFMLDL